MKPLAAPVLGGMVSSLLHVLIVTPVIFYWLHARHLPGGVLEPSTDDEPRRSVRSALRRPATFAVWAVLLLAMAFALYRWATPSSGPAPVAASDVILQTRSGEIEVTVSTAGGRLLRGRTSFDVEFRSIATGRLVDAGEVRASGAMSMPGMVMSAGLTVTPGSEPGRYVVTGEFGMAGAWQLRLEWRGAAGAGSLPFEGVVQ